MALYGHALTHAQHSMHSEIFLATAFPSTSSKISTGQAVTHSPDPLHLS